MYGGFYINFYSIISNALLALKFGGILMHILKLVNDLRTFPAYSDYGIPFDPVIDISASQELFK